MASEKMCIGADLLYDGKGKAADATIIIQGDRIIDIIKGKRKTDVNGVVTPAFIDPHSHIGMERQGEPQGDSEVDDFKKSISPLQNPVDSIYFDDRAFKEAVDFGVLYSCVVPGSSNPVGGKAVIINNFSPNRKNAVMADYGFKMALGFNPRSGFPPQIMRHNTRMGNACLIEQSFSGVIDKAKKAQIKRQRALFDLEKKVKKGDCTGGEADQHQKWIESDYRLSLCAEEWALLELLSGEKKVKVHVHKEDDALYLIELKKKYGLNVTAEHACSIQNIDVFRELSQNGIPVIYGPMSSLDYKVELVAASYKNVIALMQSKVKFGLMSDHPVVLAHHLRDSLKYFLIQGMCPEDAIGLITRKNAAILGIDDRLGTVETGKLASLIVWDRDPLHLAAFPTRVIAEGRIIRSR